MRETIPERRPCGAPRAPIPPARVPLLDGSVATVYAEGWAVVRGPRGYYTVSLSPRCAAAVLSLAARGVPAANPLDEL